LQRENSKKQCKKQKSFSSLPPQNESVPGVPMPPAEQKGDLGYGYP
jgi:hypothetical protein